MYYRINYVNKAKSYIGCNEYDGSYKKIIDLYNKINPRPRGYKVKYTDNWCATFVSAVAKSLGYESIFPLECSCGKMIEKARSMGIWIEADNYVPKPGDLILYDWNDTGLGDCKGWPDHVGIVESIVYSKMVILEGNKNNAVGERVIEVNSRYIRGYITPKYSADCEVPAAPSNSNQKSNLEIAKEVIKGKWGNWPMREIKLKKAGYDYKEIKKLVNQLLRK